MKSNRQISVDWGHLIVLALIAGATLWYNVDARSVSTDLNNLLLLQPVAIVTLLLCLFILPQCFRVAPVADEHAEPARPVPVKAEAMQTSEAAPDGAAPISIPDATATGRDLAKMLAMGAMLGLYVFGLNVVGFDVASFVFMVASMLLCGERRPLALIAFPAILTFVTIYGFKALMPYPMPTLLF